MKLIIESWRNHINSLKTLLLIEGRIENVKKKYPDIQDIVDFIAENDPSGNQKYLAWTAKQANMAFKAYVDRYGAEEGRRAAMQVIQRMTETVKKFHKSIQRLDRFGLSKDINSYKYHENLVDAMHKVEQEETQAAKRAEEKRAALSEAEVIEDTEGYFIVRPMSTEASCYFGKGTRWCISADRSNNYFNSYTKDGHSFYFVFLKHLSNDNKYKKLAFVYDRDGQIDSIFDAPDDQIDYDDVQEEALVQNLLFQKELQGAYETYLWHENARFADEPSEKDELEYVEALNRLGIDWDPVPENETSKEDEFIWRNEEIREQASEIMMSITGLMEQHVWNNPAGPTEEDYAKIQREVDQELNHAYVHYDEYDEGKYYYNGGMSFDFDDLEWLDEYETDNEEIIEEVVREAADNAYVYVDEVEVYNNEARLDFTPDYDEEGLDGFEKFAERILSYDSQWQEIYDASIEEFKKRKLIPAPDMERESEYWPDPEEKKKQMELPGILSESKRAKKFIIGIRKRK